MINTFNDKDQIEPSPLCRQLAQSEGSTTSNPARKERASRSKKVPELDIHSDSSEIEILNEAAVCHLK